MLRDLLESMTKEELIDFICAYNEYLFVDFVEELEQMGRAPVCVAEFYDCEYQMILHPEDYE